MEDITFSNLAKKTDFPQLKLDPENYEHTNDLRPETLVAAVIEEIVEEKEEVVKEIKVVKKAEVIKETPAVIKEEREENDEVRRIN